MSYTYLTFVVSGSFIKPKGETYNCIFEIFVPLGFDLNMHSNFNPCNALFDHFRRWRMVILTWVFS